MKHPANGLPLRTLTSSLKNIQHVPHRRDMEAGSVVLFAGWQMTGRVTQSEMRGASLSPVTLSHPLYQTATNANLSIPLVHDIEKPQHYLQVKGLMLKEF